MKGCDFQFSIKRVWGPGEEITWTPDGHARRGIENASIRLVKIQTAAVAAETPQIRSTVQNKTISHGGTSARRCVILPAMDVERTIEFILKTQAQTDLRMAGITKLLQQGMRILAKHDESIEKLTKTQERMTNAQERLTKAQERLTSSQERLTSSQEKLTTAQKGTQTSIEALSHIVADLGRAQKRTELKMAELSDAQKATERTLKTFISSLGRRNSRNNHKI